MGVGDVDPLPGQGEVVAAVVASGSAVAGPFVEPAAHPESVADPGFECSVMVAFDVLDRAPDPGFPLVGGDKHACRARSGASHSHRSGHAEGFSGRGPGLHIGMQPGQRQGREEPHRGLARVERSIEVFEVLPVRDDLGNDEQVDRHTRSNGSGGVEVVREAPVRCPRGHDEACEGRGHDGAVGEPPERPIVRGRSELGPRRQTAGSGVDVWGGEDRVRTAQSLAAELGVAGRAQAPAGPSDPGALCGDGGEVGDPGGEGLGAGLAGEVEQEGGQVPNVRQVGRGLGRLPEDSHGFTCEGRVDPRLGSKDSRSG